MEENKKYEKGTLGWLKEQQKIKAKKDGFDDIEKWLDWKRDPFNELEKKYGKDFADWARKNRGKVPNAWINAGCHNDAEYRDYCAQSRGFEDHKDRRNVRDWINILW